MNPRTAALYVLGGAVAMVVIERVTKRVDPGKATPIFIPDSAPGLGTAFQPSSGPASVSAPPPPARPVLVQANPVPLLPGGAYRVTVTTHGGANVASLSMVISEAQKRGFVNVNASKNKPPGWPGAANGDYYISGVYNGPPKTQARSEGNIFGSVDVNEVWLG